MADVLDLSIRSVQAAGKVLLEHREELTRVEQQFAHDVKLAADRKAEELILEILREGDPGCTIQTEERGFFQGYNGHTWHIDPLDGTVNYYHGQHHFCSSVACYQDDAEEDLGIPLAGAVLAPPVNELFQCRAGEGSFCNGRRLSCSDVSSLDQVILSASFGSSDESIRRMQGILYDLLPRIFKLRIQGSTALEICAVASGRLSAMYQTGVKTWDFAAAGLILQEAGGVLVTEEYAPGMWNVLAAAPGVAEELSPVFFE